MSAQIITEKQNLQYLNWDKIRNSSGTAGSFLKSYEQIGKKKIYYKLSDYNSVSGIIGHENVNEIIVDRLLDILNIEHLHYKLILADIFLDGRTQTTYVCASENFRTVDETKIALDAYYQVEKDEQETPLQFCIRNGWGEYIWDMLVVDFLILNRDRHGANIEVLRNSKDKTIRLAPLFDHGISLLFSCKNDFSNIDKIDVLEDKQVQCFVGSRSAYENLKLIPPAELPQISPLSQNNLGYIFSDIDRILPPNTIKKIAEMLTKRVDYYVDFCNQRKQK